MGGLDLPEISCTICGKPIDLAVDLNADENGKAVHGRCYVQHITSPQSHPPAALMAD